MEEGSCYSLLGGIVLRKQERPVIDFNRERCNDAVLSPGVPANNRTASTHLIRSVLLGVEFSEHEPQPTLPSPIFFVC